MGLKKTIKIWKCDTCGKEEPWGETWRSKITPHKTWDEVIVVCSEECKNKFDKKGKK